MRLTADGVAKKLEQSLAPAWFLYGHEPLLIEESCDAIRAAARSQGYDERVVETIEGKYDWNTLRDLGATQSLFASRRIIEFRLNTTRLADSAGKIMDLIENPPPDTVFIVIAGRVDSRSQKTKWFKRVDEHCMIVECAEVRPQNMVNWLMTRMTRAGIKEPGKEVAQRMAWFLEGNLLASAQEIDRLALMHGGKQLTVEDVEASLSDHARFTSFGWVDSLMIGRVSRALRILDGLEREGMEPILVQWALAREIRLVAAIAMDIAGGMSEGQAFKKHRIWSSREKFMRAALNRFDAAGWLDILDQVSQGDRIMKGRGAAVAGQTIWDEFERLSLLICGVPVGQSDSSGRRAHG